jgi:hypothetical protein
MQSLNYSQHFATMNNSRQRSNEDRNPRNLQMNSTNDLLIHPKKEFRIRAAAVTPSATKSLTMLRKS